MLYPIQRPASPAYCGKISFSLYLLHAIVLFLMKEMVGVIAITPWFLFNYAINLGVVLILCIVLASLGFYFIKTPFLKLRKRYGKGLECNVPIFRGITLAISKSL